MLVRILWVPPQERELRCGEVADLPAEQAAHLVALGEAEYLAEPDAAKPKRSARVG